MRHTWMNFPNKQTQKCTRCGTMKYKKDSRQANCTEYHYNGTVTYNATECYATVFIDDFEDKNK